MNLFSPKTGGHPLYLDDLVFLQTAYAEIFGGIAGYFSPTGNSIIWGIVVNTSGSNITYTNGFVMLNSEVFRVPAGSFPNSFNPADQLYFLPEQVAIPPSPDTYEDQSLKNVHFQRTAILKYYDSGTDSGGALYSSTLRVDSGDIIDWTPPPGTVVGDFFDATGLGINQRQGWAICNGINQTPDLRGFITACATNVPNSGAAPLSSQLSSVTNNLGDAQGVIKQSISQTNLPNVSLPVSDPGHFHYNGVADDKPAGDPNTVFVYGETTNDMPGVSRGQVSNGSGGNIYQGLTQTVRTGVTVGTGGSGTAIDFRQPTKYFYKIMKLN